VINLAQCRIFRDIKPSTAVAVEHVALLEFVAISGRARISPERYDASEQRGRGLLVVANNVGKVIFACGHCGILKSAKSENYGCDYACLTGNPHGREHHGLPSISLNLLQIPTARYSAILAPNSKKFLSSEKGQAKGPWLGEPSV
jgi:hypothetical protein